MSSPNAYDMILVHSVFLKSTHFLRKLAENWPKNGIFLGEMHRHMSHEEEQKTFFAAARLFWPEGCLRDFLA